MTTPRLDKTIETLKTALTKTWGEATREFLIEVLKEAEALGVEDAEIVAVLDDRTSPVCRHLHDRLVPMTALSAQKNALLTAARHMAESRPLGHRRRSPARRTASPDRLRQKLPLGNA